jgi:hypothetical protein
MTGARARSVIWKKGDNDGWYDDCIVRAEDSIRTDREPQQNLRELRALFSDASQWARRGRIERRDQYGNARIDSE